MNQVERKSKSVVKRKSNIIGDGSKKRVSKRRSTIGGGGKKPRSSTIMDPTYFDEQIFVKNELDEKNIGKDSGKRSSMQLIFGSPSQSAIQPYEYDRPKSNVSSRQSIKMDAQRSVSSQLANNILYNK